MRMRQADADAASECGCGKRTRRADPAGGCGKRLRQPDAAGERGQALTEYALLVSVLALALFSPVFPHPDTGERLSVVMWFVELFDIYLNSFHTVITLPIP